MARKMPAQKPGKSESIVGTPRAFVNAVEREFGPIHFDLAACEHNRVAGNYFGPDHRSEYARDAFAFKWWRIPGLLWLNPPYSDVAPWAQKAAMSAVSGARICLLVPASIGANWYADWVMPFADVYSVGRMKFEGHSDPYPKDLVLCHFWRLGGHKTYRWRWEK